MPAELRSLKRQLARSRKPESPSVIKSKNYFEASDFERIWQMFAVINDKLDHLEARLTATQVKRYYYVRTIQCLRVEKQGLLNYIKEMEKLGGFPSK